MLLQRSVKYYWTTFLQNEIEAGSAIENIMTDRLGPGLQVKQYISKNYTSQVNQALSRHFFSVFSETSGRGYQLFFDFPSCMHLSARFYEFHFKFKE